MDKKTRKEAIRLTIKLYSHKHGDELAMEIIDYLDRIETMPSKQRTHRKCDDKYFDKLNATDNKLKTK